MTSPEVQGGLPASPPVVEVQVGRPDVQMASSGVEAGRPEVEVGRPELTSAAGRTLKLGRPVG